MKKIEDLIERFALPLLVIVAFVTLLSRYFSLGDICYYMHIDEVSEAYEAITRANTGASANAADPSLFILVSSLIMKIKGGLFSLKLFRLLSVAAGLFGLVFTYLTVQELTGKKRYALLSAVLVASLPVYFISQRTGIGAWLFLEIIPAAYYFLIRGTASSKKSMFIVSGLLFALCMFTCDTAVVVVPLFVLITGVYLSMKKKCELAGFAGLVFPAAISIVIIAVTPFPGPAVSFASIPDNLMNFMKIVWDDGHPYNVSSTFGTVYVFSIPCILVGAFISIKKLIKAVKAHEYDHSLMLWVFILCDLLIVLMCDEADVRSANALFFAITLLLVEGLVWISENIKGVFIIELAVYSLCLGILGYYYRANFNSEVNNSTDHEQGTVVDKSVGEAVKETLKTMPDKEIAVVADDFGGRDLMIALFAGENKISVNPEGSTDESGNTVYVINQAEHQDMIDDLTGKGWGNIYLKEFVVCYKQ